MPAAIGDYLILDAIRASGGTALAVDDEAMIADMQVLAREEGISAAPEGAATLAAAPRAARARACSAATSASCCSTPARRGSTASCMLAPDLPVLDPDDPRALERVAS